MNDWDDLRVFLAVARHGSLSAAAVRLNVNHSTVSRRLAAFEARLGARLFDRMPDGLVLASAGSDMLETAERIEADFAALGRRLADRDSTPSGVLRVTAPEALVARVLLPQLPEFNRRFPDIEVGLIAADEPLSLYRREADVAVRATRRPPETLVGRRLCGQAMALYGADRYLESTIGSARRLPRRVELAWIGRVDDPAPPGWVQAHLPRARLGCRVDSKLAALAAVKAGLGVAPLPCRLGDDDADLRRLPGIASWTDIDIWLLSHPDARNNARVAAYRQFAVELFEAEKDLFEGRRPRSGRSITQRAAGPEKTASRNLVNPAQDSRSASAS
ncbi:MAG: LysR family transcriptional regulator [Xanthomonadaceae bacterium]|nr:LysR family transcriptional regulator [Xanthomonadaceae bacterium]